MLKRFSVGAGQPHLIEEISDAIDSQGACVLSSVVSDDLRLRLREELVAALEQDRLTYGSDYRFYGMVHALMIRGPAFLALIEHEQLMRVFEAILGHGCIVHAYNSSSMPPGGTNFSRDIHVDCPRFIPGYLTNLGFTLALDPFTDKNGSMEIAPDSFLQEKKPSEAQFDSQKIKVEMPAGDAILFNARCWHRGGLNQSDQWRHAVTINMCRAYMRQQFDYPKMMADSGITDVSQNASKMLGYHVRMPMNMHEFLLPPDERPYRPGQE